MKKSPAGDGEAEGRRPKPTPLGNSNQRLPVDIDLLVAGQPPRCIAAIGFTRINEFVELRIQGSRQGDTRFEQAVASRVSETLWNRPFAKAAELNNAVNLITKTILIINSSLVVSQLL